MKKKINNVTALNAVTNLVLQFVTILSGFIIPRLILKHFGSEVNGLISSLNQFLNYITILEGGVSAVIMANLYKPLLNNDKEKLSSVIKTVNSFFKKIAYIFIAYTLFLAVVYPLIFNHNFSFMYVSSLIVILSIILFIQYNFSITWRLLLNADKKVYLVSFVQIILVLLNLILFVVLINVYPNIHFLKLVAALVFVAQPIIYRKMVDKFFDIDPEAPIDNELLKNRWDGFGINVAYFIHYNTDVTILTIFTNLKVVSVYSIYSLVTNGIKQIIMSIAAGISPSLGHVYNSGNIDNTNTFFDRFEFIIMLLSFYIFTIGGLLITPFVMLYTKGITDANYYQPLFGILIVAAEAVYCLREPFVSFSYAAKKFKKITKHAYIEAALNICISLIFVAKFKLIGVAIGTLVAMLYRAIYHVYLLKTDIIHRPIKKFVRNISIFAIFTTIGVLICTLVFPINDYTIINWIINAIIYSLLFAILYLVMVIVFFKEQFKYYKSFALKIFKKA